MQSGCGNHIDQRVEGKQADLATQEIGHARLRDAEPVPEVRLARVVAPGTAHEEPILIEAHGVRIAVRRGFDREVLRDVLAILVERAA